MLTLDNGDEFQTSYPNQFGTELVKQLQAAAIPFTTEPIRKASPLRGRSPPCCCPSC